MASIKPRKRKDGSIGYTAEIRLKRNGAIVHSESKTFDRKALAKAWGEKRELELQTIEVFGIKKSVAIKVLLTDYIDQFNENFGRSKKSDLKRLAKYDIAKIDAYQITAKQIIAHCIERNKAAKPQTVQNDLIWLRTVLRTMKDMQGHSYSLEPFEIAARMLRSEKLIAKANIRDRRPTGAELWKLSRYFAKKKYRSVPMLRIMWFAIYSARRDSEITRLKWSDNDDKNRTGIVRNLKHPTNKDGNHQKFKYPRSAWKIVQKQPHNSEFIFPYNSRTISAYFADACKILGINDLHFHDLRHEAISRLFENGLSIPQVQLISLHSNWSSLKRYANLKPELLDI